MSDLQHLKDIWQEIGNLRKRLSELEHDDGAPKTLAVKDGVTAPAAVTGIVQIYADTADGDLKVVFGDGTIKTIVTDT